jgi:hypothetical protein
MKVARLEHEMSTDVTPFLKGRIISVKILHSSRDDLRRLVFCFFPNSKMESLKAVLIGDYFWYMRID